VSDRRRLRIARVPAVVVVTLALLAGCGGSSKDEPPGIASPPPVAGALGSTTTSTTSTSVTGGGSGLRDAATATLPPGGARVTVGRIEVPVPAGWTVVRGKDTTTLDDDKVKGSDSACLEAPTTEKDGIPFECAGVLILTGTAFDNSAEGQSPYAPDNDYQWYPGTDVPACEPDFPLVRSKIVESALAPISGKNAAYRRLTVQCEKRSTVHEAVSWTLPLSHIAVVSVFHPAEARSIWAGARLT